MTAHFTASRGDVQKAVREYVRRNLPSYLVKRVSLRKNGTARIAVEKIFRKK